MTGAPIQPDNSKALACETRADEDEAQRDEQLEKVVRHKPAAEAGKLD